MAGKVQTEKDKAALVSALAAVRGRILAEAEALPVQARSQLFLGSWDVSDLLAHLIGWDHANRAAIADVLNGALPGFYTYYSRDWGPFNTMLIARHRKADYAALLAGAGASHGELLAAIGQIPVEELDRDRGIRFQGWKVTIARLLQAEQRDEEEHWQQLRAFAAGFNTPT
jgi:hypothetical protein